MTPGGKVDPKLGMGNKTGSDKEKDDWRSKSVSDLSSVKAKAGKVLVCDVLLVGDGTEIAQDLQIHEDSPLQDFMTKNQRRFHSLLMNIRRKAAKSRAQDSQSVFRPSLVARAIPICVLPEPAGLWRIPQ